MNSIISIPISQATKRWPKLNELQNMYGKDVWLTMMQHGWIAGGCIRSIIANEEIEDVDVFFPDERLLYQTLSGILFHGGKIVRKSARLTEVFLGSNLPRIQLVKKYFSGPVSCISSFDFTVTMFALSKFDFYMGAFSLYDLQRKRIAMNEIQNQEDGFQSSTGRLKKYLQKGYDIDYESLKEFATAKLAVDGYAD